MIQVPKHSNGSSFVIPIPENSSPSEYYDAVYSGDYENTEKRRARKIVAYEGNGWRGGVEVDDDVSL